MERKVFLDNIRWMTVLLVLLYHVVYLFNSVGVFGAVTSFSAVQYQDILLYLVYPWFMALLFLIAGISARYALQTRTHGQFLRERTRKLLVPSTLGLLVLHWTTGYLYTAIGEGLSGVPLPIRIPIIVLSGTGPLWFIQMLWLFSLFLVLIRKLDRSDRLYRFCGNLPAPVILLLAVPVWLSAQVGNLPVLTTYRFGIYLFCFLLGYFVFSHERIQTATERIRLPMLIIAVVLALVFVRTYFGQNYTESSCLRSPLTNLYLWAAILAILGCGKARGNKSNALTEYLTKSSFGIYIVHYPIAVYACWGLSRLTALPVPVVYLAAALIVLLGSPALYELLHRIPLVRFCVLGISKQPKVPNR